MTLTEMAIAATQVAEDRDRLLEDALVVAQRVEAGAAVVGAHAAVTDAVGQIIRQTKQDPPTYLVKLLFSFKGVSEVEVPADRIHAA